MTVRRTLERSALAAVLVLGACGDQGSGRQPQAGQPVEVVVVETRRAAHRPTFPATIEAAESVELATRISGAVDAVLVDVGSRVRRGDTLVRLDEGDVEARIRAARAQADLARKTFRRIEALAADGAASDQELDEAWARLEAAEAALGGARAQAGYTALVAPVGGVVTRRLADPGDLAAPGRPLLELAGAGAAKIVAHLPGALAGTVAEGDPLRVESGEAVVQARVSRVVPVLDPGTRRFRVEATAAGGGLRPGSYARVSLESGGESSLWIPADALVRRGQLAGVYTVEDDHLRLRWIRIGVVRGDAVEVLAGLGEGRTVVRHPGTSLLDGRPVSRVRMEAWAPEGGLEGTAP